MPHPDQRLRRLIADLAAMKREDSAAILDLLEPSERDAATRLLQDYAAGEVLQDTQPDGQYDPTLLSKWLVERLEGAGHFDIAPHMLATTRAMAAQLFPLQPQTAEDMRGGPRSFRRLRP